MCVCVGTAKLEIEQWPLPLEVLLDVVFIIHGQAPSRHRCSVDLFTRAEQVALADTRLRPFPLAWRSSRVAASNKSSAFEPHSFEAVTPRDSVIRSRGLS